jgi:hypothetical protein
MKIFEQELTVESLIKYAESEKIWLPEFQRPFVWDYNQIRLLIDSLFHNYTISSILIWDGTDELARRRVGGSMKEIKIPELSTTDRITYLLDGQQRTTTLTLCFTDKPIYLGSNTKKKEIINLYWDTSYLEDDPERRWIFDDEAIFTESSLVPEVRLEDLTQEEIFSKYGARFVKLKHAYSWNSESDKVLKQMNNDASLFIKYMNSIQTLQKEILYRRVYDIEQKGSLEQVLEVFERINTKNTKLSIFDIMVAKTYRRVEDKFFDLRTYLSLVSYNGSVNGDYFKNVESIDLSKSKLVLDEGSMLSIIAIMLKKEFKINAVLKLKTNELIDQCKYIHDRYLALSEILFKMFNVEAVELYKYQPIIKFLSAFTTHVPKINLSEQQFIQKWFWNTLLYNRYPGSQNERIARDFKYIQEHSLTDALALMKNDNSRNFQSIENSTVNTPSYFDAYYYSKTQQLYRAMILLLKSNGAKDFYNGIEPIKTSVSNYELEEHHIFPDNSAVGKTIKEKYKDTKYDGLIDNIANIALITRETNNNRIKKKDPSVYIKGFEQEYIDKGKENEFKCIMESQFINTKALKALKEDDFETFLFERTKALMNQVHLLCD